MSPHNFAARMNRLRALDRFDREQLKQGVSLNICMAASTLRCHRRSASSCRAGTRTTSCLAETAIHVSVKPSDSAAALLLR